MVISLLIVISEYIHMINLFIFILYEDQTAFFSFLDVQKVDNCVSDLAPSSSMGSQVSPRGGAEADFKAHS